MLLSRSQAWCGLRSLTILNLLELHLGVPFLLQLLDLEQLGLGNYLVLLLLQHFVQSLYLYASCLLLLSLLISCRLHFIPIHIRFHRGNRVAKGANSTLNQVLNLFGNQYLVIIVDNLVVCLQGVNRMCHLVSKFESTLLFLLENMWADHELLSSSLDQVLVIDAISSLGQGCIDIVPNKETICWFATSTVILTNWGPILVF